MHPVPAPSPSDAPVMHSALIVSDDPYARAGIRAQLEGAVSLVVVGDAEPDRWDEALSELDPDLVVWDGASVAGARGEIGGAPVLSLVDDTDDARRALGGGAAGVLLRGSETERIEAAAHALRVGLFVVDDAFVDVLPGALGPGEMPSGEKLTPREAEVLELMAQGLSNREIAESLEVSVHTAKFHVNAILAKLGAQTRTEAVVLAARLGLLQI